MTPHTCSAKLTSADKCTGDKYPRLLIHDGARYCANHLPPAARKAMQVNCTHSFVDPRTGGDCCYCGAVVPFTPL